MSLKPMVNALAVLLASMSATRADDLELFQFREVHLAVDVELRVYAAEEAAAKVAAEAAYARIDELNRIFSDYDAESEVSRLARSTEPTKVSPELWFLLTSSRQIYKQTDGSFDVTLGALIKQWRRARRQKELPTPAQIAEAKSQIGMLHLKFDCTQQTVQVLQPGLQFDFGGIAKGYIAEEAFKILEEKGCPRSLVGIAGDIFAGEPPPDAKGWKIGIAPLDKPDGSPSRFLSLKRQAVSTSGDAFQFAEIDGVRYSHIVDPKTGLGLTERSSVTIVAPHGWIADGYATAVCLVGKDRGIKLLGKLEGTAGIVVTQTDDGRPQPTESAGFAELVWRE